MLNYDVSSLLIYSNSVSCFSFLIGDREQMRTDSCMQFCKMKQEWKESEEKDSNAFISCLLRMAHQHIHSVTRFRERRRLVDRPWLRFLRSRLWNRSARRSRRKLELCVRTAGTRTNIHPDMQTAREQRCLLECIKYIILYIIHKLCSFVEYCIWLWHCTTLLAVATVSSLWRSFGLHTAHFGPAGLATDGWPPQQVHA